MPEQINKIHESEQKESKKIKVRKLNKSESIEGKKINIKNKIVTINGKQIELEDDCIMNPFFTGIDGGSILSSSLHDIYQNYKRIFVLCLKEDVIMNDQIRTSIMNIHQKLVKKTYLIDTCKFLALIPASTKLLRNYFLRKRANQIPGIFLREAFSLIERENIKFDLDEIVIPMLELTELKVDAYIKMYGSAITLEKISNAISFVSYYNKHSISNFDEYIINLIMTLDSTCYWKNSANCNFNMDDIFNKRSLSYNGHRLDQIRYATISGAKTLNNLFTHFEKKRTGIKINDDDYLVGMKNDGDGKLKAEHMNIYQVLRESEHRTFYATTDEGQFGFTKDDIADLFDRIIEEKYRFHLLNVMLVSKELCHFIINNKRVLIRNADLFEKYKPLYGYLFGYAWTTFYLEESIFTTRSTKNNRFVFDDETAHELPLFPFSMENLHNSPYIPLLLNRDLIDTKTNCMSIGALEDYKKYYGLCTHDEALKRFNRFASGNHNINIFKDLDSKIFSISGSIMPACLQKRSPLIDICTNPDMSFDDVYGTYFYHYYGESDIDVMCGVATLAEFFNHASKFLETLTKNLECRRSELKITPNKKMAVVISKHFFRECIHDLNNELGTNYSAETLIKVFEESLSSNDENINTLPKNIINYFYVDYVQEKNKAIKKWRTVQEMNKIEFDTELLTPFNAITPQENMAIKMVSYDITKNDTTKKDSEMYYYINDFRSDDEQVSEEKNYLVFKFSESIKYKISSEKLKRTVEIFKIDSIDPFNTVARFHKPCVRAYLQGDKFYMLPSFISAMMTMVNIDYKYFAGSRDPIEIINKYRMRGYSVILNANEKKSILMYNKYIDNNNGMFKITDDSQAFGTKDINDKIFKPGVYKLGLPNEIYTVSKHRYINTVKELKNFYEKICGIDITTSPIDILNFTTISKIGNIAPLQMWVADAFYEHINKGK